MGLFISNTRIIGGPDWVRLPIGGALTIPWWLAGGATGCVAAYQPKSAASLAASYTDLSGSGNPAAPGVAPTWDAVNGWVFDGISQFLTTPLVPATGWSMLLQFTNSVFGIGSDCGAIDTTAGNAYFSMESHSDATHVRYLYGASILIVAGSMAAGNLGIAGGTAYRNGASNGAIGTFPNASTKALYVGARNLNGVANSYQKVDVQAWAIYNNTLSAAAMTAVAAAMAAL